MVRKRLALILTVLLCLACVAALSEDIPLDTQHFQDNRFLQMVGFFDMNNDGYLDESEISDGKILGLGPLVELRMPAGSAKGIELLTGLEQFYCQGNNFTELDLSQNTSLKEVYCQNNRLTKLIVPPSVTHLCCEGNQLTELDISKCETLVRLLKEVPGRQEGSTYVWEREDRSAFLVVDPETVVITVAPNEKIKDYVKRCYQVILGREVDEQGLNAWAAALAGGRAKACQIIDGIVSSQEYLNKNLSHEASVSVLYRAMLDREPDPAGLAGWVDALCKGYTLQNIIDGFCGSAEFTGICAGYGIEPGSIGASVPADESTPRGKIEAFVKRCYKLILSREADQGGLQGWSDALEQRTAAAAQIIDGFVRSDEFVNRRLSGGEAVDILYQTMLGRAADEGGKAGWVNSLWQGYSLQHIINGFCGSPEFTAICNDYGISAGTLTVASALVKREAITPEGEEAAPVIVGEYRSEFINEEKVRAFVKHCYVAVFGREGDAEGIENYTKLILDGKKTPKKAAYEFIFSPEFQNQLPGNEEFIRILYRLYFDREPGTEELAGWVEMLGNGATLDVIVNGFAASDEFKAIVNGMKE